MRLQKVIAEERVSKNQFETMQAEHLMRGTAMSNIFLREGVLSEQELLTHLSREHRLESVSFKKIREIDPDLVARFSPAVLKQWRILPIGIENPKISVATDLEPPTELLDQLSIELGSFIYPKITTSLHIDYGLHLYLREPITKDVKDTLHRCDKGATQTGSDGSESPKETVPDAVVIRFLTTLKAQWANVFFMRYSNPNLCCWTLSEGNVARIQNKARQQEIFQDLVLRKVFHEGRPYVGDVGLSTGLLSLLPRRPSCGYLFPLFVNGKLLGVIYADHGSSHPSSAMVSDLHLQKQKMIVELETHLTPKNESCRPSTYFDELKQ